MHKYCLTYFLVKFEENGLDYKDFAEKLGLDLELLERFGTECTIEIGRNENYNKDINVMIRESIKDLIGKEEILLELKNKYNLKYVLERVPILDLKYNDYYQKLSLDDDIIEFMYKTKTKDELDYFIYKD